YQNINSFKIPDTHPFSEKTMRQAIDTVVARHDILRTTMHLDGYSQPLQLIHATTDIPLTVHDLRGLSAETQRDLAPAFIGIERATGFDFTAAPLLRVAVHIESDDAWRLTFGCQLAIADGWTLNSLLVELLEAYRSLRAGMALSPYEVPAVRFADFIAAERV